jgi:hypothetical protein
MRCLPLVAFLSFLPGTGFAASFSAPLPDLVGVVDFTLTTGKEASFDFGQPFSSIQNVWIEVEAQVFAHEFDVCGTVFDPQPCEHVIQLLGFVSLMDIEDSPVLGIVFSGGLSFSDDLEVLEASGTAISEFTNTSVGWDFLLDGQGSLTLFWNGTLGDPDRMILNVIEPSGEIFNARLIVEGTPVPEPSTFMMLAAGLAAMASGGRWLRE